jgi:hypothetical protein
MLLAKPQHAILGLWLTPLFAFFGGSLWPGNRRWFAIASTAVLACATFAGARAAPPDYAALGYYTVIFSQVLPHSQNVTTDLNALGLDESYESKIGTHAYSADSGMSDPAFVQAFMQRTSYARLGWYFFTHPRDARMALEASLAEGGRQRPPMGNFDRSSGFPDGTESQSFALWSNAKRKLFHQHGIRYLNFFVWLAALICAMAAARRKTLPPVLVAGVFALAGMGITEMLIAALADAIDVTRHYFIAATILDLQLLILLVLLTGMNRPARA